MSPGANGPADGLNVTVVGQSADKIVFVFESMMLAFTVVQHCINGENSFLSGFLIFFRKNSGIQTPQPIFVLTALVEVDLQKDVPRCYNVHNIADVGKHITIHGSLRMSSKIHNNNFIIRMLYKDVYWLYCTSCYFYSSMSMMRFVIVLLNEYMSRPIMWSVNKCTVVPYTSLYYCKTSVILFSTSPLYPGHTEAATVLRPIFWPNRVRSQKGRTAVPVRSQCGHGRSHKSPYGRCSDFSRSAEFWNVQNSSLRLCDRSTVGLLSVCSRTARTVVAVRSPSALTLCII